ncbi:MAG: aminopeptidase [Chloroflexi bacterium]|nr:aminopeptidase [Chloroflexota bacterium]
MSDPRIQRLARLLVRFSAPVRKGDKVAITGSTLAEPLLRELYAEALRAGGHPFVQLGFPGQQELLLTLGSDEQLTTVSPIDRLVVEEFDCLYQVMSEQNTRGLSGVDPARQALLQQARRPLAETYLRRSADGSLRWSLCMYPTPAYAQDADMSTSDFEDFVYAACLLDHDDPIAAWQEVKEGQQRLVDFLSGKREVHLVGPDTDLRFSAAGRTWISDYGTHNMPAGEVFTGPVEGSVEGTIRFSYPASVSGRTVEDVRLRFKGGRVVEYSAATNEEFLGHMLDMDEGARVVGEFAFGTNRQIQRFTRNILFDEKIGGTVHLAVGASIPGTGGQNQSALHWDMVCDLRQGSEVRVDGELFARDGVFSL